MKRGRKTKSIKEKKILTPIYLNQEERQAIDTLCQIVAGTGKRKKPRSQVITRCALSVAANPDLIPYIYAPETISLKMDPQRILYRQRFLGEFEKYLDIFEAHGVELPKDIQSLTKINERKSENEDFDVTN